MSYSAEYHRSYYQANKARILARNKAWAKRNPEKVRAMNRGKKHNPAVRAAWEARNPEYVLWNAARQRAKRDGLQFTIERSDVIVPEFCPLLGLPIKRGGGRMNPNSPSLDRIDNSRGYVPGNVWVISWRANRIKCDASIQELRLLCAKLLKKFRTKKE